MKTCVNCEYQSEGHHCPECGQKLVVKRVTFNGMISDFFSTWIGFDNKFGRTIRDMVTSPNLVVRSYLAGNRIKYIGPFGYIVIMTALMILSFDVFQISVEDFMKTQSEAFSAKIDSKADQVSAEVSQKQKHLMNVMANNFRLIAISSIPFMAISMGWFFRKERLNYVERLVTCSYISSTSLWLTILMYLIYSITDEIYTLPFLLGSVAYVCYCIQKIFPQKSVFIGVVRALAFQFSGFIMWLIAFILLMIPFMV